MERKGLIEALSSGIAYSSANPSGRCCDSRIGDEKENVG